MTKEYHLSNLNELKDYLNPYLIESSLFIITEESIWKIWGTEIKSHLSENKYQLWIGPNGEKIKELDSYQRCIEYFIQMNINRRSIIMAIGGGAVSDFAGFVAATILRGIPWLVLPTTLLSMIDASIGGKVGLNLTLGKNLIGQFYLPKARFLFFDFLKTLPLDELKNGQCELIKYAFLDKNIYEMTINKSSMTELIISCAQYKNKIVQEDFYESHLRKVLNLGHTFGHVFEKLLQIPHGLAIILGLEFLFLYIDHQESMLSQLDQLKNLFQIRITLTDFADQYDVDKIIQLLSVDKKKLSSQGIDMVLCKQIGEVYIKTIPYSLIINSIKQFLI